MKAWRPTPASVQSPTVGGAAAGPRLCNVTDVAPLRTRSELERVERPGRDPREGYGHGYMSGPWDPWAPSRIGYAGGPAPTPSLAQVVALESYLRDLGYDCDE